MALTVDDTSHLGKFKAQYLQLLDLDELSWPSSSTLRKSSAQEWLFKNLFDRMQLQYLPNDRYQARALKRLLELINGAIEDPNEDEISDDLMSSLSSLLAAGVPNEADEAQRKSFVTYTLSHLRLVCSAEPTPTITTLESRAIISSSRTTGLRTWEAALHLCNYLTSRGRDLIQDKHILELGAGTGVLSILCAKYLKARHVAATDGDEGIVDVLRENIFLNGLEGDNRIESLVLRWGWPLSETTFADESPFDVVLGADITYDKQSIAPLVSTVSEILASRPNAEALISAPIRNEETFAYLMRICAQNGLSTTDVDFPLQHTQSGPFYSTSTPIKIVRITKKDLEIFSPPDVACG